jgi:uncharacterized protein
MMKLTNRPNDGIERRDMLLEGLELRVDETSGAPIVSGYAAVFNSLSDVIFEWDLGRFREKILPGAFRRTINNQNVPLLVEHANLPLATTRAGTLLLAEDDHGLHYESTLEPSDPDVQRLVPKMRRGDLNKSSFGFIALQESMDESTKPRTRIIHEARLFDVSIVARPAYPATDARVRSILADDGLDAESIAELFVRLRQGLILDDDDKVMMRRLVEACQPFINVDLATVPSADPLPSEHSATDGHSAQTLSGPEPLPHPLAWYREQIASYAK